MSSPSDFSQIVIIRLAPEMLLKSPSVRRKFQNHLRANIQKALRARKTDFSLLGHEGRMEIHCDDLDPVLDVLKHTFGISSYTPVDRIVEGGLEAHKKAAVELYSDLVKDKTYAVRVKRLGEKKKLGSPEMEREIGGELHRFAKKVDLKNPEVLIKADVAGEKAYFYTQKIPAAGGYPIGIQGRALTLISGGFDSVVAAWYMMKRGALTDFVFCNLAGAAYERMVIEVTKTLCEKWAVGTKPKFFSVDFDLLVADLKDTVAPQFWQVVLKRQMYRVACRIARDINADVIVTGEAIGQVSSQTLSNLNTIDAVADLPVLRPLIGFDKDQIIRDAQRIGTAHLSEKIPEFCALNKRKPSTKTERALIEQEEKPLDMDILEDALALMKTLDIMTVEDADLAQQAVFSEVIPEGAVLIDCQMEDLYDSWHVPGSIHYTPGALMKALKGFDKTQTYILYCPFGTQSAVLAEKMQKEGFEAYSFKGGIKALKKLSPASLIEAS